MRSAVVLSGGAALAAFEVGVLKALVQGRSPSTGFLPFRPDVITGTSAGAFNASLLLSFANAGLERATAALESVWLHHIAESTETCGGMLRLRGTPGFFINPACAGGDQAASLRILAADSLYLARQAVDRTTAFLQSTGTIEKRTLDALDISILVSGEAYRDLVAGAVNLDAVRQSSIQLRIAATNWRTGTVRIFSNADMTEGMGHEIVLGSGAVPGIFPPVEIDGDLYADGGLGMNTPIGPSIDAGAEVIHVVYVNPDVDSIPIGSISSTLGTCYRMLAITLAVGFDHEIRRAKRINTGLDALRGQVRERGDELAKGVIETAGTVGLTRPSHQPYRHLTIHRHFLRGSSSAFDWLTFRRPYIEGLIADGFRSAIEHDCKRNQCIGV